MSRPSNRQLASGLLFAAASLEDAVGGYFVDTVLGR